MSQLELRRQLLLAESELNRRHLTGDIAAFSGEVRALIHCTASVGSLATCAVTLFAASQPRKAGRAGAIASWIRTFLDGASLITTLWVAFRRPHDNQ
jgi:hypothetical protein